MGRLARELMVPPDYVEQGAYILDLDSKPPCVKHRPSGLMRDLPTSFIHSCSSVQVCYIDKNWSDRNVVVVDPRGHSQFQLALLFGEAASLMRLSPEAQPVFAQPVGSEVPQAVGEVGAASSTKQEQVDDPAACAGPKIEPGLNAEQATCAARAGGEVTPKGASARACSRTMLCRLPFFVGAWLSRSSCGGGAAGG